MAKDKNEQTDLQDITTTINKRFGEGALMRLNQNKTANVDAISSGSAFLDRALGTNGYPRGRIIEIFGPESSGKTTLTLHAIAQVHAQGKTAAFVDAEHAFDTSYAQALGVDLNRLLVAQPDCGEQGLDIAAALVESGNVDLLVLDSVAALVPKAEIDGEMADNHVGLHARLMSRGVRKITAEASKRQTTVIFINQLRQKIGVTFGNPETTTGGNALRFFASIRIDVRRVGKATSGEQVIGNRTRAKVVKNKLAPPFQEAEFDIRWGQGIDRVGELLELGLETGLITRAGAHYSLGEVSLGQGRERARQSILDKPELAARLEPGGSTTEKEAVRKGSESKSSRSSSPQPPKKAA